jgi:hypothetical protein
MLPGHEAPLFRRVGPIERVTVHLSGTVSQPTATPAQPSDSAQPLPAQFHPAPDWHLTHRSLTSEEVVAWNWQYKEWFAAGGGLSTYYLHDEALLDTIARLFSRLVPVRTGDAPAQDYEYRVAAGSGAPSDVLPGLLFYTSASGEAQFLALYNQYDAEPRQAASVSIHEIVQVEIADAEAFRMKLYGAQQAAIRYRKKFWS